MTSRAIEQMIKAVEEETRKKKNLQIIRHFHRNGDYSLEELFDKLKIPEEKRAEYAKSVAMAEAYEDAGRDRKTDPALEIFTRHKEDE